MVVGPTNNLILIELEYAADDARHTIRLHARAVNPTPHSPGDNYDYLSSNTGVSAELTLLDTLSNFGAQWSANFAGDWTLRLRGLWGRQDGVWLPFATLTLWPALPGAVTTAQPAHAPTQRRVYRLMSEALRRRRLWLRQTAPVEITVPTIVTPSAGGIVTVDQDMIAYLSGDVTALLAPDGTMFLPAAEVQTWWDRPRA